MCVMSENFYHVFVTWHPARRSVPVEIIVDEDCSSSCESLITVLRFWSDFFFSKAPEYAHKLGKLFLSVTDVKSGDRVVYSIRTGKEF